MGIGFTEANSGIQYNPVPGNACPRSDGQRLFKICFEILHQIRIVSFFSIMHQTAGNLVFGDNLRHPLIVFQPPDIINHMGAGPQRLFCHPAFAGIHRDDGIILFWNLFDYRYHPVNLLLLRNFLVAWSGGLSSHIDNGRSLLDHLPCMGQGVFRSIVTTSVGEGVRCHIQDSHNIHMFFCIKI